MKRCAIIDDYQGCALDMADWDALAPDVEVEAFRDRLSDEDALARRLGGFEIVCAMRERTPFPRSMFEKLPRLELLLTSGMRNLSIDGAAARDHGVTVCGTPAVGTPTAELAWGLILALARSIPAEDRTIRAGGWQETLGVGLEGRTLGVIGLGRLGSRVARIGKAFGMEVVAWSRNLTEERCREVGVALADKETLLRTSDVVTIHLLLSERTRGLIGASDLALLKPGSLPGQHLPRPHRRRGGADRRARTPGHRGRRARRVRRRAAAGGPPVPAAGEHRGHAPSGVCLGRELPVLLPRHGRGHPGVAGRRAGAGARILRPRARAMPSPST